MTTLKCPEHAEASMLNHVDLGDGMSVLECVTHIGPGLTGDSPGLTFTGCGYWTTLATATVARLTTRQAA